MRFEFPPSATLESPKWYLKQHLQFLGFNSEEIEDFFTWCDNKDIDIETFCEFDQKQLFFRYLIETK